jgi:hypothetical protein
LRSCARGDLDARKQDGFIALEPTLFQNLGKIVKVNGSGSLDNFTWELEKKNNNPNKNKNNLPWKIWLNLLARHFVSLHKELGVYLQAYIWK